MSDPLGQTRPGVFGTELSQGPSFARFPFGRCLGGLCGVCRCRCPGRGWRRTAGPPVPPWGRSGCGQGTDCLSSLLASRRVRGERGLSPLTHNNACWPELGRFVGEPRWALVWKIGVPGLCDCACRLLTSGNPVDKANTSLCVRRAGVQLVCSGVQNC